MPRARILPAITILCTAVVMLLQHFGGRAFTSPEDFRQAWLPPVLKRISSPLFSAENLARDALARAGRKAPPDPRLVFLALDNDSVSIDDSTDAEMLDLPAADEKGARALKLMSKGWPWSREVYALAIERLIHAGAKVVALDLNFPTSTPNDPAFRACLDAFRGQVLIGANFAGGTPRANGTVGPSLSRPADTLIPESDRMDDRVGIVDFWPDTDVDDVIRSAQYRLTLGQVLGDTASLSGRDACLSLAALAATKAGSAASIPPGFESQPFRFSGPPGTYIPHSIFEIFAPDYWKRNYGSGAFFRGKIVILGGYGNWQHDEHPTPFGSMPGPELQINAINALLHREFLRKSPPALALALIALGGLLPLLLVARFRTPWSRVAAALFVDLAWIGTALELFNHAGLILPLAVPLGLFNLNSLFALFHDAIAARREGRRIRHALERYVSRNIVREMLDNSQAFVASLGGTIKPATILFSDIRNFSTASARRDPHELVLQLNEYLSAMVECVFEYDGTLDKFIGDAVMAVWGNVHTCGPAADACNALRAAGAMRRRLADLNAKWAARDLPPFEIGIALNHGQAVIGNVGSPHRMEYTVIGDAVNTSWRLQELTKELGENLILGESVARLVENEFQLKDLGLCTVPKTGAVISVYTLAKESAPPPELSADECELAFSEKT